MFLNSKPSVRSGASWGTPSSRKPPLYASSLNSVQVSSPHHLHRIRELKRKPVLYYQNLARLHLELMVPLFPPPYNQWGCRPRFSPPVNQNQTQFLTHIYPKVQQRRPQGPFHLLPCPGIEDRMLIRPCPSLL